MKIIDKLSVPINYDCFICINHVSQGDGSYCKLKQYKFLSKMNNDITDKYGVECIQLQINDNFVICCDYKENE